MMAALWAGSAQAQTPDIVITSGERGGAYYSTAARLQTWLRQEHDMDVALRESEGSLQNLERLDDPEQRASVGLSQADALKHYLKDHPEFAQDFVVLADVGKECAFLVAARNGPIAGLADLKQPGVRQISVGDARSGAALTWAQMTELEPAFANTTPVNVEMSEALLQIKVGGEFSPLEAVMLVRRPFSSFDALERMSDEPDVYRFVPITADDLANTTLPDGSEIYTFEEVTAGGRRHRMGFKVRTLCTRGLMIGVRSKLSADQRKVLSDTMLDWRSVGQDQ